MQEYAEIGTLYLLKYPKVNKKLFCMVIENNFNDNTSTLTIVEDCPEVGMQVKVDAKWLYERTPVGPIFQPDGEIVMENGIEFIRPHLEEEKLQTL